MSNVLSSYIAPRKLYKNLELFPIFSFTAELAQVDTFFPARISALASKMGQIKKINKATTLYQMIYYD